MRRALAGLATRFVDDIAAWQNMWPVGRERGGSVHALMGMLRKPASPVTIEQMNGAISARGVKGEDDLIVCEDRKILRTLAKLMR